LLEERFPCLEQDHPHDMLRDEDISLRHISFVDTNESTLTCMTRKLFSA
jgi:hypothetical protein